MSSPLEQALDALVTALIARLTTLRPDISEGTVRTVGPPPYRRLDCRHRALAYVRSRPKKRIVRVDITGLWLAPPRCRLSIASSGGVALALRSELDLDDAVGFILQAIDRTRSLAYAR